MHIDAFFSVLDYLFVYSGYSIKFDLTLFYLILEGRVDICLQVNFDNFERPGR